MLFDLDPTPKYIITTIACMAPREYGNGNDSTWLNSARRLDAVLMSTSPDVKKIVDDLFGVILEQIEKTGTVKKPRAKKTLGKVKQTTKVILLNLYVAYLLGAPVRYSRNRNRYGTHKRYGMIFFKPTWVFASVGSLQALGLIDERRGFNDRVKGIGRESRIWATPELISFFHQINLHRPERVVPEPRQEIIELRNEAKEPIGYSESKTTRRMRANLQKYNDFIEQQEILLQLNSSQGISLDSLDNELYSLCLSGQLSIIHLELDTEYSTRVQTSKNPVLNTTVAGVEPYSTSQSQLDTIYQIYSPSITKTNSIFSNVLKSLKQEQLVIGKQKEKAPATGEADTFNKCLPLLSYIIRKHHFWNRHNPEQNDVAVSLCDFGINRLVFRINRPQLHRVFNRESFKLGGRFYGPYQSLPKELRKTGILINDEPTIELDYGAHHICIAYHLKGIDYREDPYLKMTTDPAERKMFKLLLLVLINADSEQKAIGGFRDKAGDDVKRILGILKDDIIRPLIQRVKDAHPQIADYFHSDAGVKFQYIDSQITEGILMKMTAQGIPCLPIHDSYIVPASHQETLRKAMGSEYRGAMGFEPVIN